MEGTDLANEIDTGFEDLATSVDSRLSTLYGTEAAGEGTDNIASLRVTERAAGTNMSVDVAAGKAWVRGDTGDFLDELYDYELTAIDNVTISTAHATLPRIDMIVLQMTDPDTFSVDVVAGTATVGATLANRTGAAALPDDALLLADVLVAAAGTAIADSAIRDRRPFRDGSLANLVPGSIGGFSTYPLGDVYDSAVLLPHPRGPRGWGIKWGGSTDSEHDLNQDTSDYLIVPVWCPKLIRGVNTLRYQYKQQSSFSGGPRTGDYQLKLFDNQGVLLAATGSIAFSGAASANVEREETVSDFDVDVGTLYVGFYMEGSPTPTGEPPEMWCYTTVAPSHEATFMFLDNTGTFPDDLTAADSFLTFGSINKVPVLQISAE